MAVNMWTKIRGQCFTEENSNHNKSKENVSNYGSRIALLWRRSTFKALKFEASTQTRLDTVCSYNILCFVDIVEVIDNSSQIYTYTS